MNKMIKNISFKIDDDNDIYQITIDNKTYSTWNDGKHSDIYKTKYGNLFDELNILMDSIQ
tara:strand:- start:117 stop:296 length:180 start_codon:yes stop_codon:yes gene_type:complete